ncbi:methyltransferase [Candidatus Woesearchaeota archaeon]|nr:methyltransferase [Candidatus Woesearchaeota archaeon]
MKALAITNHGLEEVTKSEIKEILKLDSIIQDSVVVFNPKKPIELCKLIYKSQSINKAILLLSKFIINSIEELEKPISKLSLKNWFNDETTFAVKCKKINDEFSTKEIEETVGGYVFDNLKKLGIQPKVNLTNPDLIFYVYIHDKNCYFGVDFSGFDLSKRDYKIFINPTGIKGTVAYSLLRFADYKKEQSLLDPFCKAATIPIEAALYSTNNSPNFFRKTDFAFLKLKQFNKQDFDSFFLKLDKIKNTKSKIFAYDSLLKNISAAKKNAKIANINKKIKFSKTNIEDLDLKFDKEIDLIASYPPQPTKFNQKEIPQIYHEFFYQAKLILSKKGKIALISTNPSQLKAHAQKQNFKLIKEKQIMAGKQEMYCLLFQLKQQKI